MEAKELKKQFGEKKLEDSHEMISDLLFKTLVFTV